MGILLHIFKHTVCVWNDYISVLQKWSFQELRELIKHKWNKITAPAASRFVEYNCLYLLNIGHS